MKILHLFINLRRKNEKDLRPSSFKKFSFIAPEISCGCGEKKDNIYENFLIVVDSEDKTLFGGILHVYNE